MTDTLIEADVAPVGADTLQHIGLLNNKIDRLKEARLDAERQYVHAVAREYNAGTIGIPEVVAAYMEYRLVGAAGFTKRWDEVMPRALGAKQIQYGSRNGMGLPNGPYGSWNGTAPLPASDPAPMRGVNVVYVLYDAENNPCYVGSSMQLRQRIKAHLSDGKKFTHWTACARPTREAAYQLEDQLLKKYAPYLNVRRGR